MEKKYPIIFTGSGQCLKGVFKGDDFPNDPDDILIEIQAVLIEEKNGQLKGTFVPIHIKEGFDKDQFNIKIFSEERESGYIVKGYNHVRTLKGVKVTQLHGKGDDNLFNFVFEEDTGWEECRHGYTN